MSIGLILLAIWLVLSGLSALFDFSFQGMGVVMGLLALASGVLLLLGDNLRTGGRARGRWRFNIGAGMLLLAIWLILTGLISLFGFSFQGIDIIMGILALAAGVVILIGR